jgi:hypothetical protein
MTRLGTPSAPPNIYRDLAPSTAFKLLASRLTPSQWSLLASARGIGQADLPTDELRQLFVASIPSRKLLVAPIVGTGIDDRKVVAHAQDLQEVRLRIGQTVRIGLPIRGSGGRGFITPVVPGKYQLISDLGKGDTFYGQNVRTQVRNIPKAGHLSFDSPALAREVPVGKADTVNDLIELVRSSTGTEIYADPRYGQKSVTLIGSSSTARARDLLQAVALCLTATYRRVGSAYILTDDIEGVGTRRQLWREYQMEAEEAKQRLLAAADNKVKPALNKQSLLPLEPTLALSPEQKEMARTQFFPTGLLSARVPYEKLTPAQKDEVQRLIPLVNGPQGESRVDEAGEFAVKTTVQMELLLPSIDAPVTVPMIGDFLQRYAEEDRDEERRRIRPTPPPVVGGRLSSALRDLGHRAVLFKPRSVNDFHTLVPAMKAAGLNELWLNVFSDGKVCAPALRSPLWSSATPEDLLATAIKETEGSGISVFAVVDFLRWGADSPRQVVDRTILGETSSEAGEKHGQRWFAGSAKQPDAAQKRTQFVTPFAPEVQSSLAILVSKVAAYRGIKGIVLRNVATAGYNIDDSLPPLGYSNEARLGFLRKWHTDPVDITPRFALSGEAETTLPFFDELDRTTDVSLLNRWAEFRASSAHNLLRTVISGTAAGRQDKGDLSILVLQRQAPLGGNWYAEWDAPDGSVPDALIDGTVQENESRQAKPRWRTFCLQLPTVPAAIAADVPSADGARLIRSVEATLKSRSWDGFVWDSTSDTDPVALSTFRRIFDFSLEVKTGRNGSVGVFGR